MEKYQVYQHTSPNGKVYIGITKKARARDRWKYGHGYKHNAHFYNAIKKYGWNNIEHKVLMSNLTLEEACHVEKELIALYTEKGICYNIAEGGTNGNTYKRTEKEKQHLKEFFKDYWKNHEHPYKGKHHSEESKKIMKEKAKAYWQKNYKEVYDRLIYKAKVGVYNVTSSDYREYESEKEAAHVLNINVSTFRKHLKKGAILNNHIVFKTEELTFEEALQKAYNIEKQNIHCGGQEKAVVQFSLTGDIVTLHSSIKQAAEKTRFNVSKIGEACRGNLKQSAGYFWMFYSDYIKHVESGNLDSVLCDMVQNLYRKKEKVGTPILQLSLDGTAIRAFISGKSITNELGFDSSFISKCCRGKISKAYGFKWQFITKEEYDEYKKILEAA